MVFIYQNKDLAMSNVYDDSLSKKSKGQEKWKKKFWYGTQ